MSDLPELHVDKTHKNKIHSYNITTLQQHLKDY